MDQHRKDLKTDKFAQEVGQGVRFLAGHKGQVRQYSIVALALLIVVGGYWIYSGRQAAARQKALADAMHVADAVISSTPALPNLNFATQDEKDKAVVEAYAKVAAAYSGSQEGAIAQLYVAAAKSDQGEAEEAVKLYQELASSAPTEYKRVAQLALAQLLASQGKIEEATKVLRDLSAGTSALVSKEEALLALGKILTKSNPDEARKVLEPLREARTTVSSAAVAAIAQLPSVPQVVKPN